MAQRQGGAKTVGRCPRAHDRFLRKHERALINTPLRVWLACCRHLAGSTLVGVTFKPPLNGYGEPRFGLDAAWTEIHRRLVIRSLVISLCLAALLRAMAEPLAAPPDQFANDDDFLEFIQRKAFDFFWLEANPANGL